MKEKKTIGSVLIIGGGIGGMQSALDLAESGFKVYLLDSAPAIGGTMAALDKTFPTNDCAMCIMAPKLVECARHLNIEIITWADVESVQGEPGNFKVTLKHRPRYVDLDKCTGCGLCVANCPIRNVPHFEQDSMPEPELKKEDFEKITEILNKHRKDESSLITILQDINEEFRYLPEDILKFISIKFGIPLSEIYNIATFYKAFSLKPRGKYVISVCLGTACHVRGAPRVLEEVKRILNIKEGETTEDKLFTLETVNCLGCCAIGPVVVVDGKYYAQTTIGKIGRIIKTYREKKE